MILENFWETMVLILLGNVRSLKFSEISRKIGLLIFPRTWYAWTICCLALDCSYRDEKLRQRIVLHDTKNCFQSTFKLYMKWHNQKVVKIINWLSFITPTSYYLKTFTNDSLSEWGCCVWINEKSKQFWGAKNACVCEEPYHKWAKWVFDLNINVDFLRQS